MEITNSQNKLLLSNIIKYFRHNNNIDKILPILNGDSIISIRIIDWFVTNYSKENFTIYNIIDEDSGKLRRFKVYIEYKLKLKSFSKKRFDPFCRWDRINLPIHLFKSNHEQKLSQDIQYIQTTIGQLNFFKWALQNNILEYLSEHIDVIEHDMNNRNKKHNKTMKKELKTQCKLISKSKNIHCHNSNSKTRKKREELSISAIKSIKREDVEVIVKFN